MDLDAATDFPDPPADDPATDDPATDDPATDDPATDDPATDDPATDDPATDDPATDDPATDDPATDDPATDDPATDDPPESDPVPDDPEPPTESGISVLIDDGADWTDSTSVTLTLADDDASRVCVSNSRTCTDWRDFTETVQWELEPGEGSKTVRVWFARVGGVFVSAARASDTIYLVE